MYDSQPYIFKILHILYHSRLVDTHMVTHVLLIISGGLAGMRAVLEAGKNVDGGVISKVPPLRSYSRAAQGGIAAVLDGWT